MNLTASFIKSAGLSSTSDNTKSSYAEHSDLDGLKKSSRSGMSYERDDILSHSLALTDHIYGLYAIELWRYDEGNGKLYNVSLSKDEEAGAGGRGLFIKRVTQEADPSNVYSTKEAIDAYCSLTNPSCADYLPAKTTDVGVGLPGVLWCDSSKGIHNPQRQTLVGSKRNLAHGHGSADSVSWRKVDELAKDPDQPFDERLQSFAKAGFKLAAGIPFDSNGHRGIVIFFGNPHSCDEKIHNPINARFMRCAAQTIGSSAAIQAQMHEMKLYRDKIRHDNWHIAKIKIKTIVRFGGSLRKETAQSANLKDELKKPKRRLSTMRQIREASSHFCNNAKEIMTETRDSAMTKTSRYLKKLQGGSAGIPPSFTNSQTMLTFIGVFITHLILSRLDLLIQTESNKELSLVLPPLGALTTLQFSLTAAPASQPRNALFAQVLSVTIALLLCYIPNLDLWLRSALAPAIVIPCMARLGITHPPAGAAAVVFSSGKFGWVHMGIFLSGVCISITTAVMINNWSDKRQYPTSWYLINKSKAACTSPKE